MTTAQCHRSSLNV